MQWNAGSSFVQFHTFINKAEIISKNNQRCISSIFWWRTVFVLGTMSLTILKYINVVCKIIKLQGGGEWQWVGVDRFLKTMKHSHFLWSTQCKIHLELLKDFGPQPPEQCNPPQRIFYYPSFLFLCSVLVWPKLNLFRTNSQDPSDVEMTPDSQLALFMRLCLQVTLAARHL